MDDFTFTLSDQNDHRHNIVIKKVISTPAKYPRNYGQIKKSLYRKKRNVIKDAYCFLDINDIVANKEQPRTHFEDEKIQELAESIMQNGLLQPIVVREYEGKYQIVVGERRYRACKLAGITEVPCIIQELDDNQTANAALVENIQRENLSAIEEALAYQQILDTQGLTQAQLAEK